MNLSIIVPVLDEAPILPAFLPHLRARAPSAEVIVVDGGSRDGTRELARALCAEHGCIFTTAPRGRAPQMNAGAACARGEALWFLHADSTLPDGCAAALRAALRDPTLAGGCFRLRMAAAPLIYRVSDSLGNVAVDLFGISLGDHGIFCRREVFEKIGGYPPVSLMEDARFYEAMHRHGRVRQLRPAILTSARTYEAHGPWRTTLHYFTILVLYVLRAPASWQRAVFDHLRTPASHASSLHQATA